MAATHSELKYLIHTSASQDFIIVVFNIENRYFC